MMHTKDKLAAELRKAGLLDMAAKAEKGLYHDFLSPYDDPAIVLDHDLVTAGTPEALALRKRHHNGEFDATLEECEEWAKSADGQAAIRALTAGRSS